LGFPTKALFDFDVACCTFHSKHFPAGGLIAAATGCITPLKASAMPACQACEARMCGSRGSANSFISMLGCCGVSGCTVTLTELRQPPVQPFRDHQRGYGVAVTRLSKNHMASLHSTACRSLHSVTHKACGSLHLLHIMCTWRLKCGSGGSCQSATVFYDPCACWSVCIVSKLGAEP
jgi:hypothetical protein